MPGEGGSGGGGGGRGPRGRDEGSAPPVVAMQSPGKNFTSTGCAVVCEDDYRLLCELPRLSREHFPGQGACLLHTPAFLNIPEVSLLLVVMTMIYLCYLTLYCIVINAC